MVWGYDHQKYIFHIPKNLPKKKSELASFHFGLMLFQPTYGSQKRLTQYIASLLSPHRHKQNQDHQNGSISKNHRMWRPKPDRNPCYKIGAKTSPESNAMPVQKLFDPLVQLFVGGDISDNHLVISDNLN